MIPGDIPLPEEPVPAPGRPDVRLAPRAWVRANLVRTPLDAALTVVFGGLLLYLGLRFLRFVFVSAEWEIVQRNLTSYMVGRFDRGELWRPSASLLLGALAAGLLAGLLGRSGPSRSAAATVRSLVVRLWPLLLLVVVLLAASRSTGPWVLVAGAVALVVAGRVLGRLVPARRAGRVALLVLLAPPAMVLVIAGFGGVGWDRWGGMLLTLFLAVSAIALCFPLGVLLALGRRSTLPVARLLSVLYIELIRGVPLVALLLMGALTIGFFLPSGLQPGDVVRAIIVLTLFTAAYVAEIVRGGLQSVPRGQVEAATAVGLSPVRTTFLIVLPQALRASIPALVGQFISLFKDTSLVSIIGLIEILRVAQIIPQQADFRGQGLLTETLVFAMLLYWVGAFTMSRESQRLERRLGVGER